MKNLWEYISKSAYKVQNTAGIWITQFRPYISDIGANISGPSAKEMRKTQSVIATIVGLVISNEKFYPRFGTMVGEFKIPYFAAIAGKPGAIEELPSGVRKE